MKLRNQLLALFCLLAFIALGVLYFRTWVVQKPFGVILFLSDGMVSSKLTAARLYEGGASHRLRVETFPHLALLSNHASDFAVPDAASATTALATGVKVNNGSVAISPAGQPLNSLLDLAREKGRATGLVTSGRLTNPGIAPFYANVGNTAEQENIAGQLVASPTVDVALGGGGHDFTPESKGGRRKDGRDLVLELRESGVDVMRTKAELENAAVFTTSRRIGIFAADDLPFSSQIESGSHQPSLADMVRRAIQFLQSKPGGYLLVVDAALISRAAEQNDGEHTITETIDVDHAVATALRYAGENSLVLVVGRHGIGGMTLNGFPLLQEKGVGLLGTNAFGYPSISWASGPNAAAPGAKPDPSPMATPAQTLSSSPTPSSSSSSPPAAAEMGTPSPDGTPLLSSAPRQSSEAAASLPLLPPPKSGPAAFYAPAAVNNAEHVIAVGTGLGSERLKGILDNVAIFEILRDSL